MKALLMCVLLVACQPRAIPAADFGESLFNDARLSPSRVNVSSCATCHDVSATAGRSYKPGHTLHNSAFRVSFWGGAYLDLLDAVNFCFLHFMQGVRPLGADDAQSKALYEYLVSLSPEQPSAALPLTIVQDVAEVPRGDRALGVEVYARACQGCHGAMHTGRGKNPASTPTLPEETQIYETLFPGISRALVVIEKVRHGQFFSVGGNMPLYSVEALSDDELGALLAALAL